MIPLAHFSPIVAKQIWTAVNIILLIANIILLSSIVKKNWKFSLLLFLLSGWALINAIKLGQLYLLLVFTIFLGYKLYTEHEKILSGILFGIMIPVKYFPVIFLLYFIVIKEWRVVISSVTTVLLLTIFSIVILGWNIHSEFVASVFFSHLSGNLTSQDIFSSSFQSWTSLFRRLYIYDANTNPFPVQRWEMGFDIFRYGVLLIIVSITVLLLKNIFSLSKEFRNALSFSLLTIVSLLLSPATATYHFLLLIFPIAILLTYTKQFEYRWFYFFFIATFGAIGYIPYSFFKQFDGADIFTLFAYPRLWLMNIIFITTVLFINRFYNNNQENE